MTIVRKIANHASQYFIGEVLILTASLISFPIFARILSQAEYGVMNIVSMTIDMLILFSNAGLRPALLRFFSQYERDSKEIAFRLFATLFWATILLSLIAISVIHLFCLLPLDRWISLELRQLLGFSAILVLFRTVTELILALFRIREQATFYLIAHVSRKYAGMILAIYFIVSLGHRLDGLFQGLVIGEGVIFFALVGYLLISWRKKIFQFSTDLFRKSARYGVPLIGQNFSNFINSVGDRYLIQLFMGPVAVGIYSIGYNLARYIQALIVDTLEAAMIPMTMNVWAKSGEEETRKMLTIYFSIYLFIALPIIFGLCAVAEDAIILLASAKWMASAGVVGFLIVGIMLAGAFFPATVGLHIQKKTTVVAKIMFYTAGINILMNLVTIPLWGIKGAAIANVTSCAFQIVFSLKKSNQYLKVKHNFKFYLVCLLSAVIMFLCLKLFWEQVNPNVIGLVSKIIPGVLIYASAVWLLDFLIQGKDRIFSRKNLVMFTRNN